MPQLTAQLPSNQPPNFSRKALEVFHFNERRTISDANWSNNLHFNLSLKRRLCIIFSCCYAPSFASGYSRVYRRGVYLFFQRRDVGVFRAKLETFAANDDGFIGVVVAEVLTAARLERRVRVLVASLGTIAVLLDNCRQLRPLFSEIVFRLSEVETVDGSR